MHPFNRRTFLRHSAALAALAPGFALGEEKKPDKSAPKEPKPDPYADAVLIKGEPPLPQKGAFTIVALPDTQHYSEKFPATYTAQTRWIVEQQRARNIACVLYL